MKKPEADAPLTQAEIRAGVSRLMSSAYMKSPEGRASDESRFGKPRMEDDWTGALDTASEAFSRARPGFSTSFEKAAGLKGNVGSVIEELNLAIVANRTSREELFRLGTSEEAVRLLEEEQARWVARCQAIRERHAAKADEAGA